MAEAGFLGGATTRFVRGARGVRLAVAEGGNPAGVPLLFLHGYSQAALCWTRQFTGQLAHNHRLVAADLRGHGHSDKPEDPDAYRTAEFWADDVAAVIDACALDRPILVGWSFGGRILGAYARRYGTAGLRGLVFAGAVTKGGVPDAARFRGPAGSVLAEMASEDMARAAAATLAFVRDCTAEPLPPALQRLVDLANGMTPPFVRRAMLGWAVDHDDLLPRLDIPALVIHGMDDRVLLPEAGRHIAALMPRATLRLYGACGHAPFLEEAERFDADLAAFAAGLEE